MTTKVTTGTTSTRTKPGRLTDNKWWFCQIGQHGKCATEIELSLLFEGCPCECHQKLATQPAPDTGEWCVRHNWNARTEILEGGTVILAAFMSDEHAARIVADHNVVGKLVEALHSMLEIVRDEGHADSYQPQVAAAESALAAVTNRKEE